MRQYDGKGAPDDSHGRDHRPLVYPLPAPMADAIRSVQPPSTPRSRAQRGSLGLGEAAASGGPLATTATIVRDELRPIIVGEDPFPRGAAVVSEGARTRTSTAGAVRC